MTSHIDYRQYRLLVSLLRQLSDRREVTGQIGLDRAGLRQFGLWLIVFGALFSLMALSHPRASTFMAASLTVSAFLLLPLLISEAAEAFMNPAEAFVLAHQPIRGGTYIAAKATHIAYAVARVVLAFNLVPALAGLALEGTRRYYPLTHLLSALSGGLFAALLICGVFGMLFRIVPIARLRNAAQWMQLLVAIAFVVGPQIRLRASTFRGVRIDLNDAFWSAIPTTWFTALGLIGQPGQLRLTWTVALPAMAASAMLIAVGVRALSATYMTRIVLLLRARAGRRPTPRGSVLGTFARRFSGRPTGRAAFAFVITMARRDWQFRRLMTQGPTLRMLVPVILLSFRTGVGRPFGGPLRVDAASMLPHVLGFIALSICSILTFSDRYRAAWLFVVTPLHTRALARGVHLALWMVCVALPYAVVFAGTLWLWGPEDAVLFVAYGAALTTAYVAVALSNVRGLPFASAPQARQTANIAMLFGALIVTAVLVALQTLLLFRSRIATAVAAVVLAIAGLAIGRLTERILAGRLQQDLDRPALGTRRMFQSLETVEPSGHSL